MQPRRSDHTFHIPVMGTGFMIDAPLRVAKYGISSVISLVDDVLMEQMRRFHCQRTGEPYVEITDDAEDARAQRVTAYLDLLSRLIDRDVAALQAAPFEPGSEITRYFELLPPGPVAQEYREMLTTSDARERARRQDRLRQQAVPGSIDVNIMSKGDRDHYRNGEKLPAQCSDASAALRGYAQSRLASSIVFSAGLNPRLYGYAAEFADFLPDANGSLRKKIILKVSDFHSAAVQGKFFAKHGLWVSEYRIESGLNCGGHAFATKGLLLGPILEEFRRRRDELQSGLHPYYVKALEQKGLAPVGEPFPVRLTVQGGIGTADEDRMLREYYGADGTGWGTPFLLVPEVTHVDQEHLDKLCAATDEDVYLSDSSPFGLPFWNLRSSASEEARRARIVAGHPGSVCVRGYAKLYNTEFTAQPICTASRQYQRAKLEQLRAADLPDAQRAATEEFVLGKSCICHDLAGGATRKHGLDPTATPAVCCGPNIVNFKRVATLEEMVGHIYGRLSLIDNPRRPHMFLRELVIYLDYLRRELGKRAIGMATSAPGYYREFTDNLRQGVEHYRQSAAGLTGEARAAFLTELERLAQETEQLADAACGPESAGSDTAS
jgi:hypothetical protein